MELIRGKWSKKYINCWEDKRDYDIMRRGYMQSHETIASDYCEKFCPSELTGEEKKEIQDYWASFGIKIYDYDWHRMYYHATGIHDPRFVPDLVAGLVVYEYYNDKVFEHTWRDKNMFERLFPDVPMPKTLGKRIRGRFFINETGYVESNLPLIENISCCVNTGDSIIIKGTRDTGFGKGVKKYVINTKDDITNAFSEWENCENFIVQECIKQHKIMSSLNEKSSNMIRVCSWRHDNTVDILFAATRVGVDDSVTDISFVNGEEKVNIVGIKDGYFSDKMIDQNGQFVKNLQENIKVPAWNEIKNIIKENHLLIDNFDIIGWDFTINEDGNPICFEWNISWPGTVLYQYANGPLYGENTDKIFAFLKDENNRYNYIPYYMRLK